MVHTIVDGTFRQTHLTNESSEYLARREELRLAEIEGLRPNDSSLICLWQLVRLSDRAVSALRRAGSKCLVGGSL